MWDSINKINAEIDTLTAAVLRDADYLPQTNPFKAATDAAKSFIGELNDVKSIFAKVDEVINAVSSVVGIILKIA